VCRFASASYGRSFGTCGERSVGRHMRDVLGDYFEQHKPYVARALRGELQRFEYQVATAAGVTRWYLGSYHPDVVDGFVRGIVAHATDITELKILERELHQAREAAQHLASHDPLTGLPNRLMLDECLATAIVAAATTQRTLAAVTLDVDDFKRVNDDFGHSAGDDLLVAIAQRIRRTLGPDETALRIGGDEFVILWLHEPDTDLAAKAATLVEAINEPVGIMRGRLVPSCSFGIAVYAADGTSPKELLLRSDVALYASKRTGKGRYTLSR